LGLAEKDHPFATYAKALYFHLTGIVVSTPLPDFGLPIIQPRKADPKLQSALVYPNPFSEGFELNMTNLEVTEIQVYNFMGKLMYANYLNESEKKLSINTSSWGNGLYVLHLKNGEKTIRQEKLLLNKN
jgi:hypothetical protein